jgi:hypothetical protein
MVTLCIFQYGQQDLSPWERPLALWDPHRVLVNAHRVILPSYKAAEAWT